MLLLKNSENNYNLLYNFFLLNQLVTENNKLQNQQN